MHLTSPFPSRAAAWRLRLVVAVCSAVFTVGTALHNFVIVDTALVESMMRSAGVADPAAAAPGFTSGFRAVGCVYIAGNAVGMLAARSRSRALWWCVFTVNVTQALGPLMIPAVMWTAVLAEYGVWGALPSVVTDGGAIVLTLAMAGYLLRFRGTWARGRRRPA